jgi:hypothetical protein
MTERSLTDKGGRMEESLRDYFLELGYFVVRGAKFKFEEFDVTDVDLWLYQRTSTFSRERFNVDIKNRKTPQALERIFWAKGLQKCLGLNGAMVATTDTRSAIKDFGDQNSVTILDGTLLSKLRNRYQPAKRLAEEDWLAAIRADRIDRLGGEWLDRISLSKSRILSQFDFDGLNGHLNDTLYFSEQILTVPHRREWACRLFYLSLSLALVTADYVIRDFAFIERAKQIEVLNDGLRFGTLGPKGAERIFSGAARIAAGYLRDKNIRPAELVKYLKSESLKLPVELLSEFLIKISQSKGLFDNARALEAIAYGVDFVSPNALGSDQRGIISAILDFHDVDRKVFFDTFGGTATEEPPTTSKAQIELKIDSSDRPPENKRSGS